MTPQAFSFSTVSSNKQIYVPPYGLKSALDYLIKIDPISYEIKKIKIDIDESFEKWQNGIVIGNEIYFLPYNESKVLIVNSDTDSVDYIDFPLEGTGKYIKGHIHNNKIIALPYGENNSFDFILSIDTRDYSIELKEIYLNINDEKKWHTSQYVDGKIIAAPRGERWEGQYFPYAIELNCDDLTYNLTDLSNFWIDYDLEKFSNKKFTTLAKVGNKLYAPPYSENPNFDILLRWNNGWSAERTGLKFTSRKYYSHTVASNGKIYCPPAGHDEDWSQLLIIDSNTDSWEVKSLGLGKESKKYFTGWENSKGKIYYIPRGGCVCEPINSWKSQGDLAEVLVIDTKDNSHYTVDISEYFTDTTTIEKYNASIIIDDKIFAFPYGQSEEFQTILVFDTITEKVIKEIDLNDL